VNDSEKIVTDYNKAVSRESKVNLNNTYFCPWVALCCESLYIYLIGLQILHNGHSILTLGMFLANLNIIKDIGKSYGNIYETLLSMQSTIDSLRHIVQIMNLPTDLAERADACESRRVHTKQKREELIKKYPDRTGLIDLEPIVLHNIKFSYGESGQFQVQKAPSANTNIEIMQGSFVTIVGPRSQGKATLLKILGGVIIRPESGVFIPAHLRVLHVASEPYFYNSTMYKNLTFGLHQEHLATSRERVQNICKSLGVSKRALEYLDEPTDKDRGEAKEKWNVVLSLTDRYLLNLVRALVFDPDVLVVHKPTMPFDERLSKHVLDVMKGWVTERGIHFDPEQKMLRRPTTLITSSAKIFGDKNLADKILRVSSACGIEEVKSNNEIGKEDL